VSSFGAPKPADTPNPVPFRKIKIIFLLVNSRVPLRLCGEESGEEEDDVSEDSEPDLPSDRFLIRKVGDRDTQSEIYKLLSKY
jgi:hypothetical protein